MSPTRWIQWMIQTYRVHISMIFKEKMAQNIRIYKGVFKVPSVSCVTVTHQQVMGGLWT